MSAPIFHAKIDSSMLLLALQKAPLGLARNLPAAGREVIKVVIESKGIMSYPPETAANMPPTPYYIRGRGMQYKTRNNKKSESYKHRWTAQVNAYQAVARNDASYSGYLGGEKQARAMAKKGWRKVIDVAHEKAKRINEIYQDWLEKTLRDVGLLN